MILVQINIAKLKVAHDGPEFKDFRDALDSVNASAEQSPGFVWRLISSVQNEPELDDFEAQGWLVNMSAWHSIEDLMDFIRSPLHLAIMRRRGEWFGRIETHLALWWQSEHTPISFRLGREKLAHLSEFGPTADAFTFRAPFTHEGESLKLSNDRG